MIHWLSTNIEKVSTDQVSANSLLLIYLFSFSATHGGITDISRFGLVAVSFSALVLFDWKEKSWLWFLLSSLLVIDLIQRYSHSANHAYLTLYSTLMAGALALANERDEVLKFNYPRLLLIVVMGFATLRKWISVYFMSGGLLGEYIIEGHSLYSTFYYLTGPTWTDTVQNLYDVQHELLGGLLGYPSYSLPLDHLSDVAKQIFRVLPFLVGGVELIITVLMMTSKFRSKWFPAVMLAFVWATFFVRPEYTFYSLLLILVVYALPDMTKTWRFATLISVGFLLSLSLSELDLMF